MMTNTARTLDVITLNFAENPPANFANTTGNTPPMVLRFSVMMTGWKICFSCLPNRLHLTLEKRKNCETVDIWRDLTIIKFEPVLIKKKAWLEIGFLNFKFLSTAGIETMVISAIQNKNSSKGKM